MSLIDEKKEKIGILKTYLAIIAAILLSVGAGVVKLILSNQIGVLFVIGIVLIIAISIIFMLIANKAHQEIKSLKDL